MARYFEPLVIKRVSAAFLALLSIVGYGVFVFASGPFAPGLTLDPVSDFPGDCSGPTDGDCYVTPGWSLLGNTGTDDGTHFIGTTDAQDLVIKVNNVQAARFLNSDGSFLVGDQESLAYTAGEENKLFFDITHQAIRMGSVDGTEWEGGNIGTRSIVLGFANPGLGTAAPIASGSGSFGTGFDTVASGTVATVFGYRTTASGDKSIAFGEESTASGNNSFAGGLDAEASGNQSFAFGDTATASGGDTFALGSHSVASGNSSFAFGAANVSSGSQSMALGSHTLARSGVGELAMGAFNTDYTPADVLNFNAADRLLSVGNGSGTGSESDAFTILKNGKTGIGFDNFETTSDADLLQVNGAILQSSATACTLNADADGTIICTPSDRNLKQNINDISYGLDTVNQLHPVSYEFINPSFGAGNQIGFIAQELETVIPEVVTTGPDYKSVNYPLMTAVLAKAIQELDLKIDAITNVSQNVVVQSGFGFNDLMVWFGDAANGIGEFFAGRIHTNELCVGDTCLNEAQINAILDATQVDPNTDSGDDQNSDGGDDGSSDGAPDGGNSDGGDAGSDSVPQS